MPSQNDLTQALYFIQDRLCDQRRYSLTGTGNHGFSLVEEKTDTPFVVTLVNALKDPRAFTRHYVQNQARGMWTVPIFYANGRTALRSIQSAYPGWTNHPALAPYKHKSDSLIALSEQELDIIDLLRRYVTPSEARLIYFQPERERERPHLEMISFTPIPSAPLPYQLGCIEEEVFSTESILLRRGDSTSFLAQIQLEQVQRATVHPLPSAFRSVHLS